MIGHLQLFFAELQRRKVLRIAAAYVVGAWIVLQVALALQTAMSLSGQFSATMLALLVVGFFVAVALSWFYEITPEGVKRTAPATGDAPLVKPQTTDLALAAALTLVVVVALVQVFTTSPTVPPASAPTTTAEATPAKPQPPALGDKAIAVLPFTNLSTDKEDVVFADGLTEEILNFLAQIPDLKVVSRTSSFAFKGKNTPLPDIAKALGVRHILEGSMRREGDDIRTTAQLIDVSTDTHLWSKTYDRTFADVFGVQDDVAREIAGALKIELLVPVAQSAPTTNMEAYRRYLKAGYEFETYTRVSMLASLALCKEAVALDPKFADAYGRLAFTYDSLRSMDRVHSAEYAAKSKEASETALRLNPASPWIGADRIYVAFGDFEWGTVAKTASMLRERMPHSLAVGHAEMGLGRMGSAARIFEQAAALDPLSRAPKILQVLTALARGDNAKVTELAKRHRSWPSMIWVANFALALSAREAGESDAAERYFRAAMRAYPQNPSIIEPVARALREGGEWRKGALGALQDESVRDPEFDLEDAYLLIGETDAFLDATTKRLLSKQDSTIGIQWFLALVWHLIAHGEGDNVKLRALLQTVGLVDHWKKHGWPDRCRAKGEDDFECS